MHAFVSLVHEFEEFVHDSFQELPMGFEETRVLANDVHDIRCDDRLVILPSLDLAQAQEVLDNRDQKPFLGFLVCEWFSFHLDSQNANSNSLIAPEIEPIAQQSVLRLFQDHSEPSTCFASFSVKIVSVSVTSKWVRYTRSSRIDL